MKHLFVLNFSNVGVILFLIAELLLLIVLIHGYLILKREKHLWAKEGKSNAHDNFVCSKTGIAYLLLEREELRPVYYTDNFAEVVGISGEQLYTDFQMLRQTMDRKVFKELWQDYTQWNHEGKLETEYQSKQADSPRLRLMIIPDEKEGYDCFIFQNISEEKQKLQELEQKLLVAEDASKSKTTFLSRMSHEIRTPINGIIGMLSLARGQVEKESVVDGYLQKAEDLSTHLVALVNDILDMSRIEAGKIELENKPFDIRSMAQNLRNMFQTNIEAKGLRFEVELLDFDDYWLMGDSFRLSQVIVNFLSNAQKFTSEGEIRVTFRQLLKENGIVDLMIRVHDTGIGMQPEFLNRIFRPFEQETAETSKKYGGTGLGMAISDQIIHLMGGEIMIDSMPGKGSDFMVYLHLPAAQQTETEAAAVKEAYEDDYTFAGKHILMAEDNEINAEIAKEILQAAGAEVTIAEDGEEAVEKFAASEEGYYDFILMDIQMPKLDGRAATGQIRQMARADAKSALIFALSADAFLEDERMSKEAGMDGHFAKPVDFDKVRWQIGQIVHEREDRL